MQFKITAVTLSNKAGNLLGNKMSNFSDKFVEIPVRSTNIQLSQVKVNLVATEGNGIALTKKRKKKDS
jgi:hypothetical protein